MTKIIASGNYWKCANMDLLANIIEEGTEYLLSDGTRILVPENKEDERLNNLEFATEEEIKEYARINFGSIFKGDEVIINRGRKMKGEHKIVEKTYRYTVPNTYGKQYTDYLVFTDGTKVNIHHCDVVGIEYKNTFYNGQEYFYRKFETDTRYLISVGGRI